MQNIYYETKATIEASETRLLLKIDELKQKVNCLERANKIPKNIVEIVNSREV